MPPPSAKKAAHSGFETQRRRHQRAKIEVYQWSQKKDLCPPIFFKKSSLQIITIIPVDVDFEVDEVDSLPHVANPVELDVDGLVGEGAGRFVRDVIDDEAVNSSHHLNLCAFDVNFNLCENVHII